MQNYAMACLISILVSISLCCNNSASWSHLHCIPWLVSLLVFNRDQAPQSSTCPCVDNWTISQPSVGWSRKLTVACCLHSCFRKGGVLPSPPFGWPSVSCNRTRSSLSAAASVVVIIGNHRQHPYDYDHRRHHHYHPHDHYHHWSQTIFARLFPIVDHFSSW